MKLTLEVSLDNAAFHEDTDAEPSIETLDAYGIEFVLHQAIGQIREADAFGGEPGGTLRDTNGNTVGEWSITED